MTFPYENYYLLSIKNLIIYINWLSHNLCVTWLPRMCRKKGSSSTKIEDRASFPDLTQDTYFSVNFSVLICPGIAIKQSLIFR